MTKDEILKQALKRDLEALDAEREMRELMLDDLRFAYREQWNPEDKRNRDGSRRAAITIRRSDQFLNRVKNEQRQSKPQITVVPKSEGANEFYATRRKGLIKHIQYDSRAHQAIQMAFDYAVDCGRGWFKIDTEEETGRSFAQKAVILPIRDIFSVRMDPRHERPDYSDAMWGFEVKRVDREDFQEARPNAVIADWSRDAENQNPWVHKDDVTVAEYYCVKFRERNLMEIQSREGLKSVVFEDEMTAKPHKVLREKTVQERYVHWYYLSPYEVLDDMETVFGWVPLVPIIGKETIIDGVMDCYGLTRKLIDPCRMYNFWVSEEADILANSPKPRPVGAEGQFEGHEAEWDLANESNVARLEYNPVTIGGQLVPPPSFSSSVQMPSGIVNGKAGAIEDMKAVSGIYDASLGARSNEKSGVAIRARESQGDTSNFHFPDSLAMALTHCGRILNHMIPYLYTDEGRVEQILGEEDDTQEVEIGKLMKDGRDGFGDGVFDIIVAVGPSYTSQREEAALNMIDMSKNVAVVGEGAADLIIKAQDWPMKDQVSKRIERILEMKYPGLTAPIGDEDDKLAALSKQLEQMSAQMQKLVQEREQLVQQLQKIDQEKQATEARKVQNEIQKLDLERQKLEIDMRRVDLDAQKIEADLKKADLDAATRLKIKHMEITNARNGAPKEVSGGGRE